MNEQALKDTQEMLAKHLKDGRHVRLIVEK